jgi:hypothetical protein
VPAIIRLTGELNTILATLDVAEDRLREARENLFRAAEAVRN